MSKHPRKPKKHSPTKLRSKQANQLRIIGGQWRGRKLPIVDAEGLRPTSNRIRETLFNWLAPNINKSTCLDLFAGSGALGFECLSRGALSATLIENNTIAARQLTQNGKILEALNLDIIQGDAQRWLQKPGLNKGSVNIVFIDPPFAYDLWDNTIDLLIQSKLLADGALIYIESPKDKVYKVPLEWESLKKKTAGDVDYTLFSYSGGLV